MEPDPQEPQQTEQQNGAPPNGLGFEHSHVTNEPSAPSSTVGSPALQGFDRYSPEWFLIGPQGLRAGPAILLAYLLYHLLRYAVGTLYFLAHLESHSGDFSATRFLIGESASLLALIASGFLISRIEHRTLLDYNLRGPRRPQHFFAGLVTGFVALSALAGMLAMGGWLSLGRATASGTEIFRNAFLWGCVFLLVGCLEEGMFRCYLQYTLTRGVNFWWALASVAAMCLYLVWNVHGIGAWGVYAAALIGFFPCLYLHLKSATRSAFWQAAWVTSTAFGVFHTSNDGENWLGIFAAAAIGFIFCVSIRVTGSAWWAIGCHAAWDWAETFFYGAADSGVSAPGHFLTSTPAGSTLLSGGTDGPEGSVLILAVLAMLLAWLLLFYGRNKASGPFTASTAEISAYDV